MMFSLLTIVHLSQSLVTPEKLHRFLEVCLVESILKFAPLILLHSSRSSRIPPKHRRCDTGACESRDYNRNRTKHDEPILDKSVNLHITSSKDGYGLKLKDRSRGTE